jgi:hypothetical protein
MLEQDLWSLADAIMDGAFTSLEELLVRKTLIRFRQGYLLIIFPFLEAIPSSSSSLFLEGLPPSFRSHTGQYQHDIRGNHRLPTRQTFPSLRGLHLIVSDIRSLDRRKSAFEGAGDTKGLASEGQGRGDLSS